MKKLCTIMLAALCYAGAGAIELTFWIGNQKIAPGSTIAFDEMTVNDLGTYKEVTMDPGLSLSTNIFSSDITITATCQSGQTIRMCAGGSCKGGESVTKDNVTIATGQKLPLEFEYVGELDPEEAIPTVTTLFEAEDTTEPGSKTSFILVMNGNGASLSVLPAAATAITPAEGAIAYSVEGYAELNVTSPAGAVAYSATVSGTGTVPLTAGLYIATLAGHSTKILVK